MGRKAREGLYVFLLRSVDVYWSWSVIVYRVRWNRTTTNWTITTTGWRQITKLSILTEWLNSTNCHQYSSLRCCCRIMNLRTVSRASSGMKSATMWADMYTSLWSRGRERGKGQLSLCFPEFWAIKKLSEHFLLVPKFFSKFLAKSENFGPKNPPFGGDLWAKLKFWAPCRKFAVSVRKLHLSASPTYSTQDTAFIGTSLIAWKGYHHLPFFHFKPWIKNNDFVILFSVALVIWSLFVTVFSMAYTRVGSFD